MAKNDRTRLIFHGAIVMLVGLWPTGRRQGRDRLGNLSSILNLTITFASSIGCKVPAPSNLEC